MAMLCLSALSPAAERLTPPAPHTPVRTRFNNTVVGHGTPAQGGRTDQAPSGRTSGRLTSLWDAAGVPVGERGWKRGPSIPSKAARAAARGSARGSVADGRCVIRSWWCRVHSRTYADRWSATVSTWSRVLTRRAGATSAVTRPEFSTDGPSRKSNACSSAVLQDVARPAGLVDERAPVGAQNRPLSGMRAARRGSSRGVLQGSALRAGPGHDPTDGQDR